MKIFFIFMFLGLIVSASGCAAPFFRPQREILRSDYLQAFGHEDVYFRTSDGVRLNGWLIKADGGSIGTVVFLHGYDRNISAHAKRVLWLVEAGFDVFLFDYRGYGRSEGSPTIKGVHLDAEAALEEVLSLPGANRENIFVLGQSLGGTISVYSVANSPYKDRIKALVLDSAFSSYRSMASETIARFIITWPLKYLSFLIDDYYSPDKWVKDISPVPVLIIHGDRDSVVPLSHGSRLYKKALEPKDLWIAEGKGHASAMSDEGMRGRLVSFLLDASRSN